MTFILPLLIALFLLIGSSRPIQAQTMNGIEYKKIEKLFPSMKPVTVRFRTDIQQERFTYANEKAYRTLKAGRTDYPNGSIFIKFAADTGDDPAFPSSRIPLRDNRIQIMVRDTVKYASTDGWGYAIFSLPSQAPEPPETAGSAAQACHACHRIVESRGYVFSILFNPFETQKNQVDGLRLFQKSLTFHDIKPADLPEPIATLILESVREIRSLEGPLKSHMFVGTLGEVRPTLAKESAQTTKPALLISENKKMFSMVLPLSLTRERSTKTAPTCGPKEMAMVSFRGWKDDLKDVERGDFCQPRP
jgi:hypothetical protein